MTPQRQVEAAFAALAWERVRAERDARRRDNARLLMRAVSLSLALFMLFDQAPV